MQGRHSGWLCLPYHGGAVLKLVLDSGQEIEIVLTPISEGESVAEIQIGDDLLFFQRLEGWFRSLDCPVVLEASHQ